MDAGSIKSYRLVKTKKIEWLWEPYIPMGKITIIEGDPGDGKTSFVLFLSAILSKTNRKIHIDGLTDKKINIIYQSQEDDSEDTIKPKLIKYGADCSNIYFVDKESNISLENGELDKYIKEIKANLVVLDPIQSFLGEKSITNLTAMRNALKRLANIAKENNCAVILIGHMNKSAKEKDLYRSLGSIDIVALARSVLLLKRKEAAPYVRIVFQIKNNLAMQGAPIAFEFKKGGSINYLGKFAEEDLISEESGLTKRELSKKLLMSHLLEEDTKATTMLDKAKKYSISRRTMDEARKEIGCRAIKKKDGWYWTMDGNDNGQQR